MELIKDIQELYQEDQQQEWGVFSRSRGDELRKLEKTIVFNQMVENNFTHAWKQIYQDVNEFCNDYGISNRNRIKLFIKEMEYISLYVHNVSPLHYNEQGIYPDDKSMSKHTIFLNKHDPLPVACKKRHDYISEDYNFFWDVFSQKVNICTLSEIKK